MLANLSVSRAEAFGVHDRKPVGTRAQAVPLGAARASPTDRNIRQRQHLVSHLALAARSGRSRTSAFGYKALGPRASAASAAPDEPESAEVDGAPPPQFSGLLLKAF